MDNLGRYAEPIAQIPRRFDVVSEGVKRDSSGTQKMSFDRLEDLNERLLALEKRVEALEKKIEASTAVEFTPADAATRIRGLLNKNFQ